MCVEDDECSTPNSENQVENQSFHLHQKKPLRPSTLLLTKALILSTIELISKEEMSKLSEELKKRIDAITKEVEAITAEADAKMEAIASEANSRIETLNRKIRAFNAAILAEEGSDEIQPLSKMACIRECIRDAGKGVSYEDIAEALEENGFPSHDNYRYTVINKLKKEGKILERGGLFYWAEHASQE